MTLRGLLAAGIAGLSLVLGAPAALAQGSASAAPRAPLLSLVQPLWSDLSDAQRAVLEPFETQWNTWSAQEKRSWVLLADRVPKMSPEARERAHKRIREWAELTPEKRRLARRNYRLAKQLAPDQRQAEWARYQEMTPEQRSVLRANGSTSNTAARHAGARTGLAKEAAQPLSELARRPRPGNPAQPPKRH